MPVGQYWSVSTQGGNWAVPKLSEHLRHVAQPEFRFRQFTNIREELGKKAGDTWYFDKAGNVATQGGTLVETDTIPETQFVTNQGTGSVTEYGNSVPFTFKLNQLGQFQLEPTVEKKLKDDQVKVLESACAAEYVKTELIAVCSATNGVAFTTNGTATASATSNLTAFNVRAIVDYMRKKLIPFYDSRSYVCIASITAMSGMHADTATGGWVDISKYSPQYAKALFDGEVGNFYRTRFVEETGYLSNTIGSSSLYGQAVFIGGDAVEECVVVPEEIRVKIPSDYGRSLGLAWYGLMGFKIIWDFDTDGEQHIVYVTSA